MRHLSKPCLVSRHIPRPVSAVASGVLSMLLVIAATSGTAQAQGGNPEAIFAEARQSTVEVSTNIDAAFIQDYGGSASGTGFLVDAARGWIITNAHVAGYSPSEVTVKWEDGQESKATTKQHAWSVVPLPVPAIPSASSVTPSASVTTPHGASSPAAPRASGRTSSSWTPP